jgi:hypothetical protein
MAFLPLNTNVYSPYSQIYSPFAFSTPRGIADNIFSPPIIPYRSTLSVDINPSVSKIVQGVGFTSIRPYGTYYYDSGLGESQLSRYEINKDIRYKFLDKWLFKDFPDILRMLKVEGGEVKVLSKEEAQKNDISKASESDLEKMSDFIGHTILTFRKNRKILDTFCSKHNVSNFDLHNNLHYVKKAQGKYVLKKLEEMRGSK